MIKLRRSPQPEKDKSLKRGTSYTSRPVLRQLKADFLSKCYLCETHDLNTPFEVDHLRPQADNAFPELAYDWTNLFYACRSCNKSRKQVWEKPFERSDGTPITAFPRGGLLDCTQDDIEARLHQMLSFEIGMVVGFEARIAEDEAAKNTAAELQWLHTERDNHLPLLHEISVRVNQIHGLILKLNRAAVEGKEEALARDKLVLRRLLSRSAPFTALLRSYFTVESGRLPTYLADVRETT